jgi:hypothetical protein
MKLFQKKIFVEMFLNVQDLHFLQINKSFYIKTTIFTCKYQNFLDIKFTHSISRPTKEWNTRLSFETLINYIIWAGQPSIYFRKCHSVALCIMMGKFAPCRWYYYITQFGITPLFTSQLLKLSPHRCLPFYSYKRS